MSVFFLVSCKYIVTFYALIFDLPPEHMLLTIETHL